MCVSASAPRARKFALEEVNRGESSLGTRLAGCRDRQGVPRECVSPGGLLLPVFSFQPPWGAGWSSPFSAGLCKGRLGERGEMQRGFGACPLCFPCSTLARSALPSAAFGGDFCPPTSVPSFLLPSQGGCSTKQGKARHRVVQGQEGDSSRGSPCFSCSAFPSRQLPAPSHPCR